ncbi:MAG TPA: branched-chain amino acid ABC transporter substrate-binding protein [Stellaceae bacterium]|nr:branched-chain amino acid ABC transporter substrate-binding protein [Stellaceae bacterium]
MLAGRALTLAGAVLLATGSFAQAAQTAGPVTDDLGVLTVPKGAPITVGGMWVFSGADSALGTDAKRGAEIAFSNAGNKIAGHGIKFVVEDDQCSAEGGQTAATKLAAYPGMVGVLGSACSSVCTPAAPILWKQGIIEIGTACSAPALTAADRKPEYDGFVRTIFSDIDQGAADAKYLYDGLKARKIVTVHDDSAYSQQLTVVTATNFTKLGGTVLSQEAITSTDVDMHPLLIRVATEKPDVLYIPLFIAGAAQILRQAKDTPGLEKTVLIGGGGLMAPDMIKAAGAAVVGFKIAYPNVSPEAMGKTYPKFIAQYKNAYGEGPISGFHGQAYDAAQLLMKAIGQVAKTDASGATYIGRKALRDAIFVIKFDGVSGPIACDAHGECGEFKPAVYEYTSADPSTFAIGKNPKKIYP